MKKIIYALCLLSTASILSGCVNRTISVEAENRGGLTMQKKKWNKNSTSPHTKILEKKRVWIWQDEFHNP